ncbi:MAG: 4-hydroxy-tetrahydrodipicolinate reductase [Pseudomonadota bacterium]
MIGIVLTGAKGRMGRLIAKLASQAPDLKITAEVDIGNSLEEVVEAADVVIDFSTASATGEHAKICAHYKKPIVIGTTGLTQSQAEQVRTASKHTPVVFAPNMSIGVNLMWKLAQTASRVLGNDFHIDIQETHHVHKLDRPSGTAKKLLDVISKNSDVVFLEDDSVWTRKQDDPRTTCRSVRCGEVVGDHSIDFSNSTEKLSITHHAKTRDAFAQGALSAARWIKGKPAGLYGMDDVLGLK